MRFIIPSGYARQNMGRRTSLYKHLKGRHIRRVQTFKACTNLASQSRLTGCVKTNDLLFRENFFEQLARGIPQLRRRSLVHSDTCAVNSFIVIRTY